MIRPVIIELHCAQQHERANGRDACASRSNRNIVAAGRFVTDASARARGAAALAGWRVREVTTNGRFRGYVCPACCKLMDADKKEQ